ANPVAPFLHLAQGARPMAIERHPDLAADRDRERIDLHVALHPGRLHENAIAVEMLHDAFCHVRADRIVIAAEKDGMGLQGQGGQVCRTQTSVNRRRAVAISVSTLPSSRSISIRAPSSWMPRRPMSIASIFAGGRRRTA